jgi:hypothetical protein
MWEVRYVRIVSHSGLAGIKTSPTSFAISGEMLFRRLAPAKSGYRKLLAPNPISFPNRIIAALGLRGRFAGVTPLIRPMLALMGVKPAL